MNIKKIEAIVSCIITLVINFVDLYYNFNEKDFPEYHEKIIKFNIICLLLLLAPLLLFKFARYGICHLCILIIFIITIGYAGVYYQISSFYLYFAYDGRNKIKNKMIKIMMWISFVAFLVHFISSCFISSSNSDNKKSKDVELEEEENV